MEHSQVWKRGGGAATLLGISRNSDCGKCEVVHVKSHPERRKKNQNRWDRDMWGNHMADSAASEDVDCFESW